MADERCAAFNRATASHTATDPGDWSKPPTFSNASRPKAGGASQVAPSDDASALASHLADTWAPPLRNATVGAPARASPRLKAYGKGSGNSSRTTSASSSGGGPAPVHAAMISAVAPAALNERRTSSTVGPSVAGSVPATTSDSSSEGRGAPAVGSSAGLRTTPLVASPQEDRNGDTSAA